MQRQISDLDTLWGGDRAVLILQTCAKRTKGRAQDEPQTHPYIKDYYFKLPIAPRGQLLVIYTHIQTYVNYVLYMLIYHVYIYI